MPHVRFAISSHIDFHENTLPVLLPSLLSNGVSADDIIVAIGGSHREESVSLHGVRCDLVAHNSIDYTALINVIEKGEHSDYWFLLHDTCIAGPTFYERATNIPDDHPDAVAFNTRDSMNIGAYSATYLDRIREMVLATKNSDLSREAAQQWKRWGVHHEGHLFPVGCPVYPHFAGHEIVREGDIYGTGTRRRLEYFPHLDLFKVKANCWPKGIYTIDV